METFDFNLYEELGIQPSATEQEVRAAYKKKALVHHPDRNGGVQSDEFLRVKSAFDTLIDPDKRRNYDAFHDSGEFKRDGRPMSAKDASRRGLLVGTGSSGGSSTRSCRASSRRSRWRCRPGAAGRTCGSWTSTRSP